MATTKFQILGKMPIVTAGILFISAGFGFELPRSYAQVSSSKVSSSKPVQTLEKPSVNRLQDIQIGEKGLSTRIALFCHHQCLVERHIDGFKILHIADSLTIDLKNKSSNISSLRMRTQEDILVNSTDKASVLSVESTQLILRSSLSQCQLKGREATCIDLEFSPQTQISREISKIASANRSRQDVSLSAPPADQLEGLNDRDQALRDDHVQGRKVSVGTILQPGKEETVKAINTAALRDVPSTPAIPVPVSLPQSLSNVPKSSPSVLRPAQVSLVLNKVDFREQAEKILGQRFDSENCSTAKDELDRDAWALTAMVTVGYCVAAAGDFEEADRVFKDICGLVPTNYEAFIGRAIIASTTGETSIARRFFNHALSLGPPKTVTNQIEKLVE